jgi:4-hydroxy-tetrahydrodipicolinate synthase
MTHVNRRRAHEQPPRQGADRATRLAGVFAPVLTPFRADLAPDAGRLLDHCRWLRSQGAGLAVFGTTSEANSLAVHERTALLEHLIDNGIDAAWMMPGTGCSALTDSVSLTAHAVRLGCAGVLMLPPFYYKGVSDDGLFRSFAEIIERVGDARLRVYLYHIPPVSQVPITPALIGRLLAAYPGVIAGVKDSSGDWANTQAYLDEFASHGFAVFPGSETLLLRALRHGGAGCISATANVNAAAIVRLASDWKAADAAAQQERLDVIRGIFARHPLIPALKAALAHFRSDPGWLTVRPPLVELPTEGGAGLLSELRRVGFGLPADLEVTHPTNRGGSDRP